MQIREIIEQMFLLVGRPFLDVRKDAAKIVDDILLRFIVRQTIDQYIQVIDYPVLHLKGSSISKGNCEKRLQRETAVVQI